MRNIAARPPRATDLYGRQPQGHRASRHHRKNADRLIATLGQRIFGWVATAVMAAAAVAMVILS